MHNAKRRGHTAASGIFELVWFYQEPGSIVVIIIVVIVIIVVIIIVVIVIVI
jgi:hypothetical protein